MQYNPNGKHINEQTHSVLDQSFAASIHSSTYAKIQLMEDPFALLAPQLSEVRIPILSLVESGHLALSEVTCYSFLHPSKQVCTAAYRLPPLACHQRPWATVE
jgi:hypothetical protein